jgi:hypothetical protein
MHKGHLTHKYAFRKLSLSTLTVAIVLVVIVLLLDQPSMERIPALLHSILHFDGFALAAFLSIVSFVGFRRVGGFRALSMTLGFIALAGAELLDLQNAINILPLAQVPVVNIELSHIILLIMLSMFALGILKVNTNR